MGATQAYTALFQECHHIIPLACWMVFYCFGVSASFVGSLYLLVPAVVRRLDRDDPRQIQWRTFATSVSCLAAIFAYPYAFCSDNQGTQFSGEGHESVLGRIGLVSKGSLRILFGALAHTSILYMGPIILLLLRVYKLANRSSEGPNYLVTYYSIVIKPQFETLFKPRSESDRWIRIRNQVAAPILEEIAFRGCIVPPLLSTGLHPWTVAWIAPLFFGTAHCHHALLKFKQGERPINVLLSTIFQFLYTSLFGTYAAHAFIRSKSIVAVILSHSFCNTMGLPHLHFLSANSPFYSYRGMLLAAHLIGIAAFAWGFTSSVFLPLPGG